MPTPPLVVMLAAALCAFYGAQSATKTAEQLFHGLISPDLGTVGLVLAAGLLARRPAARRWALGLFIAFGLVLVALGILSGFHGSPANGWKNPIALINLALWTTVVAWVIVGLIRAKDRAWFSESSPDWSGAWQWTIPSIVLGVLAYTAAQIEMSEFNARMERVYAFETHFLFRDADSGQPLDRVEVELADRVDRANEPLDPFRARTQIEFSTVNGRTKITVQGVAYFSYEAKFARDGYDASAYLVTRSSPSEVELPMKKQSVAAATH